VLFCGDEIGRGEMLEVMRALGRMLVCTLSIYLQVGTLCW
jgi:hypothetical protein